jgi:hypothetical protein
MLLLRAQNGSYVLTVVFYTMQSTVFCALLNKVKSDKGVENYRIGRDKQRGYGTKMRV